MPHEIYYTSAPEGVRPGQQGFCTVGTSAGIPRPLWDRLESISGYRHPFGAAPGRSPVAWAHWLLDVGGREVSVLSRLCDSGLDYTQRTNSFAHHLALEPEERAAAGPAWMLRQDGVMARQWDGRVGVINRPLHVPRGDAAPAPCMAWQRMAGDAGWAGVLAETAVSRARRPVCILFNAGFDLLPLMAEAIALLPARLRWQATFNTYFTSAPAAAVCAWRCCLANSQAAQEAIRRSGGALVLDLTNPEQLGKPPAGPWVEAARAGRSGAAEAAHPVTTTVAPRQPPRPPARLPPLELAPRAAVRPPPVPALATVTERGPEVGAAAIPIVPEPTITPADPERPIAVPWEGPARAPRRMWVLGLCAVAIGFIGVGTWLRLSADRGTGNPIVSPPSTAPVASADNPAPVWPFDTTTAPTTRDDRTDSVASTGSYRPPATPTVVPTQPRVVAPASHPQDVGPVVVTPPAPVPQPAADPAIASARLPLLLGESLKPPVVGAGVRDPVQSFTLPAEAVAGGRKLTNLQVLLPDRRATYALNTDDLSGNLAVAADARRGLRQTLVWHDTGNPTLALEVATVVLESTRNSAVLQVSWKTGALIKRPGVTALAQAVLQNSVLVVSNAREDRPREITFKPAGLVAIDIAQPKSALAAPLLPPGTSLRVERGLAAGWDMSATPEWESVGPHSPDKEGWALHFKGPAISDHAACEFDVHFAPGWTAVQSNWAAQRQGVSAAEASSADDLKHYDEEVDQQRSDAQADLDRINKDIADAQAQLKLSDDELVNRFTTRTEMRKRLTDLKQSVDQRRTRLKDSIAAILTRRADADRVHGLLAAGVKAFDDVNNVEVKAELPGDVRAAGFRLTR